MAGLLDLFGGDATQPGALYGGLLTPQQNAALSYRGLLAAAGALGQAAMPSRMPIPIGAALGNAAAAMGTAQDTSGENALKGMLVGLQGQNLASQIGIRNQIPGVLQQLMHGQGGAGASLLTGASPTGGGEVGSSAPNANVNDNSGIGAGQLYSYLGSIGATPNEAALLTSGANIESSFKPDTTHDADFLAKKGLPPGYGLWGDNADRLANMRASAGVGPTANVPWQDQAKFQLAELRGQMGDRVNAAKTPEELTALQLEYLRPKGWNTGGGAAAQRLAATREYMASPPGAKPPQYAQANTGTATDALPPGAGTVSAAGAPQSLLPPPAPGSDTLRVGGAGGLLAPPQPTATPFTNAPPINGVGAPAPGPQGGMLAPQVPQVAQAAPRPPAPSGAPGMGIGLPPVPNMDPRALAAAGVMGRLGGMGDLFDPLEKYYYQSPGYLGEKSRVEALAAAPFKGERPGSVFPQFDANGRISGFSQAPGSPVATTIFDQNGAGHPAFMTSPSSFNGPSITPVPGNPVTQLSPQQKSNLEETGKNTANLGPTNPMGAPSANAQPTPSAYGMLPPLSEQKLPASAAEAEHAIPEFRKKITDWTEAAAPAQQAEMRLIASWKALQSIESGAWTTAKSDIVAGLRGAGIDLPKDILGANPAQVETIIHESVLATLPMLKAGTPRPSQSEFNRVSENLQNPNLQPEANQQIMAEGIALARQSQNIPNAFKASQWQDPQGFETSYLAHNNLTKQAEQIKSELGPLKGMNGTNPIDQATRDAAQNAILKGAPRDAVIKRLQQNGFDTSKF